MRVTNGRRSWGLGARVLHWGLAVLILGQLATGFYAANMVADLMLRFQITQAHKSWGFVIFCLALVRIAWRWINPAPPLPADTPRWQRRASHASHALLYVLILVLPLSGWVMATASPLQDMFGIRNSVFGLFEMPDPWQPGVPWIHDLAQRVHQGAAVLLTAILAIHVGAAMYHHWVRRDDILRRMTWGPTD